MTNCNARGTMVVVTRLPARFKWDITMTHGPTVKQIALSHNKYIVHHRLLCANTILVKTLKVAHRQTIEQQSSTACN